MTAPAVGDIEDLKATACYEPVLTRPPAGSVAFYSSHVVLVTAVPPAEWPAKVEKLDGLPGALAKALKDVEGVKFSLAAGLGGTATGPGPVGGPGTHDVMVFPQALRYEGVTAADVADLAASVAEGRVLDDRERSDLTGEHHLLVCAHTARDARCGSCGPVLGSLAAAEAARLALDGVRVWLCSHVGGHTFAGNILIYPGYGDSPGDFYGYVGKNDVATLLRVHVKGRGEFSEIVHFWRGRMGLDKDAHEEAWEEAGGELARYPVTAGGDD